MYCSSCGRKNDDSSIFCHYCGWELKKDKPATNIPKFTTGDPFPSEADLSDQGNEPVGLSDNRDPLNDTFTGHTGTIQTPPGTNYRRQKNSPQMSLPVIGGICLILLLAVGIPLSRSIGKSGGTTSNQQNNSSMNSSTYNEPIDTSEPESPPALISNEAIEKAIASYFEVSSTGELSADTLSEITDLLIENTEIKVNNKSYYSDVPVDDVNVDELISCLNSLESLRVYSVNSIDCMNSDNSSLKELTVVDCGVIDDLQGIEDWQNLKELTVNNTDLSSMQYIAYCPSLKTVDVADNKISDISNMRDNTSITSLAIYGNQIHDHTPLANVKTINVWGKGVDIHDPYSYDFEKMPPTRCIKVNITNLHMRPVHSKKDGESNLLIRHCPQNYYIVLDTYQGSVYTWYRVGNDAWIGSANNYTTEYFN